MAVFSDDNILMTVFSIDSMDYGYTPLIVPNITVVYNIPGAEIKCVFAWRSRFGSNKATLSTSVRGRPTYAAGNIQP